MPSGRSHRKERRRSVPARPDDKSPHRQRNHRLSGPPMSDCAPESPGYEGGGILSLWPGRRTSEPPRPFAARSASTDVP